MMPKELLPLRFRYKRSAEGRSPDPTPSVEVQGYCTCGLQLSSCLIGRRIVFSIFDFRMIACDSTFLTGVISSSARVNKWLDLFFFFSPFDCQNRIGDWIQFCFLHRSMSSKSAKQTNRPLLSPSSSCLKKQTAIASKRIWIHHDEIRYPCGVSRSEIRWWILCQDFDYPGGHWWRRRNWKDWAVRMILCSNVLTR